MRCLLLFVGWKLIWIYAFYGPCWQIWGITDGSLPYFHRVHVRTMMRFAVFPHSARSPFVLRRFHISAAAATFRRFFTAFLISGSALFPLISLYVLVEFRSDSWHIFTQNFANWIPWAVVCECELSEGGIDEDLITLNEMKAVSKKPRASWKSSWGRPNLGEVEDGGKKCSGRVITSILMVLPQVKAI